MAKELSPEEKAAAAEKQKLKEDKKRLKIEQKQQKKEARIKAKEIAKQEDALLEDEESNGLVTFGATILIVALWLAVICVVIKLDIGGFGSTVLTPVLKDVPIVNRILPGVSLTETTNPENYGGYTSLSDAVEQIRALELELERVQTSANAKDEEIETLRASVARLREFEQKQLDFQRIVEEFYEEVVYAENGPGAEEYRRYYEEMDPTTAQYIYRQVIIQLEESKEIQDYAAAYSAMKPKAAAAIFDTMTNDLDLVARILRVMSTEDRGAILAAMNPEVAARLTRIMDPES